MSSYTVDIVDRRSSPVVEHRFLEQVIRQILSEQSIGSATISVALVDDEEIRAINRKYLNHDHATDVISFHLGSAPGTNHRSENLSEPESLIDDSLETRISEDMPDHLEGELIVSHETAVREAGVHGWSPQAELLLYVVHGMLHLCGYDDLDDEARSLMRSREQELLAIWGLCPTGLEL